MNQQEIDIKKIIVQEIVMRATALKDKYTDQKTAKASWVCIFSQSDEYQKLLKAADNLGEIYRETPTGPIFFLNEPIAGNVRILKIREYDSTKPERGDADFTVLNYESFKKENLGKENFKLIPREGFEMIELKDKEFNVLAYFSNPPIEEQYKDLLIEISV